MFEMEAKDIVTLIRWYRNAPKQFARASGTLLNNLAFGARASMLEEIDRGMVVRNKRFVASKIRVHKSHTRQPISSQEAIVGSVDGPRFSGWVEQELGKKTDRTRVFSMLARRGSAFRPAQPSARLKPSNDFPTPDDYPGLDENHRAVVMLQSLGRQNYRKPFVIKGHRRIKPGVYRFGGGKRGKKQIHVLQQFKAKTVQPRRFRWLSLGYMGYMRRVHLGREWSRVITRINIGPKCCSN